MKSATPWSIKGIDPEARLAAKEAAKREGMTLGAWISQKIIEENSQLEGEAIVSGVRPKPRKGAIVEKAANAAGQAQNADGIDVGAFAAALRDVAERTQRGERRSEERIDTLRETLESVVDRVDAVAARMTEVASAVQTMSGGLERTAERAERAEAEAAALRSDMTDASRQISEVRDQTGATVRAAAALIEKVDALAEAAPAPAADPLEGSEQVLSSVSARLDALAERSDELSQQTRDALDAVAARMDETSDRQERSANAIGDALEALTRRLEAVEDAQIAQNERFEAVETATSVFAAEFAEELQRAPEFSQDQREMLEEDRNPELRAAADAERDADTRFTDAMTLEALVKHAAQRQQAEAHADAEADTDAEAVLQDDADAHDPDLELRDRADEAFADAYEIEDPRGEAADAEVSGADVSGADVSEDDPLGEADAPSRGGFDGPPSLAALRARLRHDAGADADVEAEAAAGGLNASLSSLKRLLPEREEDNLHEARDPQETRDARAEARAEAADLPIEDLFVDLEDVDAPRGEEADADRRATEDADPLLAEYAIVDDAEAADAPLAEAPAEAPKKKRFSLRNLRRSTRADRKVPAEDGAGDLAGELAGDAALDADANVFDFDPDSELWEEFDVEEAPRANRLAMLVVLGLIAALLGAGFLYIYTAFSGAL